MFSQQSFSSRLFRQLGGIFLALSACSISYAQRTTAPTASEDPVSIDESWQKASSKYDAERTALLKQVEVVDHQGPFRSDWESLQKYDVPEWYKDAKFGILSIGESIRSLLSATN